LFRRSRFTLKDPLRLKKFVTSLLMGNSLCISSSSEPEDPDNIDSSLITAVDLVSLPSKEGLTNIGQDYEGRPPHLIWCKDSH
jgi:hypothetical protein